MAKKKTRRKQRRPDSKARTSTPLISVAMIARNEENHLVAAMESAKRFADEVILVDTGSTDRTVAVARQLGMKVHRFSWIHDFAAARNESFRHCRGRYIFWQDPDEVVPEHCANRIVELAEHGLQHQTDEFRLLHALNGTYRPPEEDIPGYGPGFRVLKPKMVRNCSAVFWDKRIHESLFWRGSIKRYDVGEDVWVFNHGTSSGHDTATGDDYYYALMVLGHRDHPTDPHYSLYLAECAIVREADQQKALEYLNTIKDPGSMGSPELLEKYWVMRGRAFKAGAIAAHDQGMVEPAKKQAATALGCYQEAVKAKGSHAGSLEAATLVLYMGGRDDFIAIAQGVVKDHPGNLMAAWFLKLAELYQDPAELNVRVGNWLFNLRNGTHTMEQAFEMVTQGQDPLTRVDVEGAWAKDEQRERKVRVVIVYRIPEDQPERLRNLLSCIRALYGQAAEPFVSWELQLVEQDNASRSQDALEALFPPLGGPQAMSHVRVNDDGPFNRGAMFNRGVSDADVEGSDLVCLMDADMIVDPGWLQRCLDNIAAAEKDGRFPGVMLPYSQAIYMDAETTAKAIEAGDPFQVENIRGETFHSQGGCIWVTAELYEKIGGHDERYVGWGSADRDFYQRLMVEIGGAPPRIDQPLFHMDHPKPDGARADANAALFAGDHDVREEDAAKQ